MNAVRRKYQAPLERISEVSCSPGVKRSSNKPAESADPVPSASTAPAAVEDPLSMGESYSSYYRIKQEKEQQQRLHYREELREKEEQIDKLK